MSHISVKIADDDDEFETFPCQIIPEGNLVVLTRLQEVTAP